MSPATAGRARRTAPSSKWADSKRCDRTSGWSQRPTGLARAIGEGRFREDLFYRLNVARIEVPSLRAHRSDIPDLAEHILRQHGVSRPDAPSSFTDEAMRALLLHDYPGNVRELENLIERAVVLARGPLITLEDLPALAGSAAGAEGEPPRRAARDADGAGDAGAGAPPHHACRSHGGREQDGGGALAADAPATALRPDSRVAHRVNVFGQIRRRLRASE